MAAASRRNRLLAQRQMARSLPGSAGEIERALLALADLDLIRYMVRRFLSDVVVDPRLDPSRADRFLRHARFL
jgi:hypothetical protein